MELVVVRPQLDRNDRTERRQLRTRGADDLVDASERLRRDGNSAVDADADVLDCDAGSIADKSRPGEEVSRCVELSHLHFNVSGLTDYRGDVEAHR